MVKALFRSLNIVQTVFTKWLIVNPRGNNFNKEFYKQVDAYLEKEIPNAEPNCVSKAHNFQNLWELQIGL